jgi:hypothetical protein
VVAEPEMCEAARLAAVAAGLDADPEPQRAGRCQS